MSKIRQSFYDASLFLTKREQYYQWVNVDKLFDDIAEACNHWQINWNFAQDVLDLLEALEDSNINPKMTIEMQLLYAVKLEESFNRGKLYSLNGDDQGAADCAPDYIFDLRLRRDSAIVYARYDGKSNDLSNGFKFLPNRADAIACDEWDKTAGAVIKPCLDLYAIHSKMPSISSLNTVQRMLAVKPESNHLTLAR